jgi:hypothetical protein
MNGRKTTKKKATQEQLDKYNALKPDQITE